MKLFTKHIFATLFVVLAGCAPILSLAQSRVVIDYDYDEAGNITGVQESVSLGPPSVSLVAPANIRIGSPVQVVATGINLKLAEVTTTAPNVLITNVETDPEAVVFNVQANEGAPLTPITLTFTTVQGSDSAQLQIQPALPAVSIFPAPITVSPSGSVSVLLELTTPDAFDQTLTLSTLDSNVATVSPASVIIPAGQIRPSGPVTIGGASVGNTELVVTSSEIADVSVTVAVTEATLPAGENIFHANALGVTVSDDTLPEPLEINPILGSLSVLKEFEPPPPPDKSVDVRSPALGLIRGPGIVDITPHGLVAGSGPVLITVSGRGLGQVASIAVTPSEDISVGTFTASTDGTSGTFSLDVAQDAVVGARELTFDSAAGPIRGATPDATRIFIASDFPQIRSVDPVVLTRLAVGPLVIRGLSLGPVESISATPSEGIVFGTPTVSADSTLVTVPIVVAEDAPLGPRLLQVTTPAGTTSDVLSVSNRLDIVNGPVAILEQFFAPNLGVLKGEPEVPDTEITPILTSLGVSVGATLAVVVPASGVVGTDLTLSLIGSELDGVTDVQFIPDDGLIVGAITPALDGGSVDVQLSIAIDAPKTVREMRVVDNGVRVIPGSDAAARFRITAPLPVLEGTSPNFVVAGALATEHLLIGRNFTTDATVQVLPPDGVSVGTTTVATDGRSLRVDLSADVDATLGDRVVTVETPTGNTSPTSSPSNTLTVTASTQASFSPIAAPLIGVNKLPPDEPSDAGDLAFAPVVGVTLGAYIEGLTPSGALVGSSFDLVVRGQALDGVTSVFIEPADGLSIDGPLAVSPDGTEVRVPITVDLTAPRTVRQVLVFDGTERVEPANPAADRLSVATVPTIDSIDPIQEQPGVGFSLTVRGIDFDGVTAVVAEPAQDIGFGNNLTINPEGTELTIDMSIESDAVPGARVIRLLTPAGATPSSPGPENTFTVVP